MRHWYWFRASVGIAYQIVVEKPQGKISYQSELDKGTEFALALPTAGITLPISHP